LNRGEVERAAGLSGFLNLIRTTLFELGLCNASCKKPSPLGQSTKDEIWVETLGIWVNVQKGELVRTRKYAPITEFWVGSLRDK
jgi:hypothetical protein